MTLSLPTLSVQDLLEKGAHFGHKRARWNPRMAPYIYKEHHGVHIIDLPKTIIMMERAMKELANCVREGGRILFVGTKLQARAAIKEAAQRCGQYYVNHRWLGGTLTNWKTISESLKKLREVEEKIGSPEFSAYTKKEQLEFHRALDKYNQSLGGIRDMGGVPDMLFIIDINKEMVAVKEARHLGIPIVAIVDTNTDPSLVDYPIPGNDDALRAIQFYCDVMARTVILGLQQEWAKHGGGQADFHAQDGADASDQSGLSSEGAALPARPRAERRFSDRTSSGRESGDRRTGSPARQGREGMTGRSSPGRGGMGGDRFSSAPRTSEGGRTPARQGTRSSTESSTAGRPQGAASTPRAE